MLNNEKFKYKSDIKWSDWNSKNDCFKKYSHVESKIIYGLHSGRENDFSIIIPTFRRADLLKEALESAINQKDFDDYYEIIVIDNDNEKDLPTDMMMKEYCEKYKNIIYYRNSENIGMFANWNRCIEVCKSKWFCMLHDDDYITQDYLATMKAFELSDDVGIVFNEQNILDETGIKASGSRNIIAGIREYLNDKKENKKPKLISWKFPQTASSCATLYNRRLSMEIGGFDDTFDPACDWVMWGKMEFYHKVKRTGKRLSYYRFLCNGFLRSEIQRYVMIYAMIFAKVYFEAKKYSKRKVRKIYSEYAVRVYRNMTTSNPQKKEFYDEVLREMELEKKYYSVHVQNRIYFKYLAEQGIEKIFRL